MVTRNCVKQGYPFREAISSALPLCDEFIIVDGFSTDGTFEILSELNDDKIHIYQQPWKQSGMASEPIRYAINSALKLTRGTYVFHVDANEIIHSESLNTIGKLPEVFPETVMFAFPYYQFMGKFLFNEEFRVRFAKKSSALISVGDGWTLGTKPNSLCELKRLLSPSVYLSTLYYFTGNLYLSNYLRYCHLPRPIFRYYAIDPELFLNKIEARSGIYSGDWSPFTRFSSRVLAIFDAYVETKNKDHFWKAMCKYYMEMQKEGRFVPKEIREVQYFEESLHPEKMRGYL